MRTMATANSPQLCRDLRYGDAPQELHYHPSLPAAAMDLTHNANFFPYHYKAKILRVLDGDTVDVELDLGFSTYTRKQLELIGYTAPKRQQPGFDLARTYLTNCLQGKVVIVSTERSTSFGRWSAHIYVDGQNVSTLMAEFLHNIVI